MKGQIEIMGLIIIVILVTIGMFLSVAFQQDPTERTTLDVYSDEKMAGDFLITFLETNAPCDASMRQIAIDCIRNNVSGAGQYACEGETDSCVYLNNTLSSVLDQTLNAWGYSYKLVFNYDDGTNVNELITYDDTGCDDYRERSAPGIQPISLFRVVPGSAWLQLDICI